MHSRLYKACKQLVQILVTLLHVVQLGLLLLLLPELIGNSAKRKKCKIFSHVLLAVLCCSTVCVFYSRLRR